MTVSTAATSVDAALNASVTIVQQAPFLQENGVQQEPESTWATCPGCTSRYQTTMQHDCTKALSRRIQKLEKALNEERAEHLRLRITCASFFDEYQKDK